MTNAITLKSRGFSELTEEEAMRIEGGLLPIVIPAGVILGLKIAAGVAAVATVAAGVYVGYKQTTKDLETKYGK